jgi:hypothetical protein
VQQLNIQWVSARKKLQMYYYIMYFPNNKHAAAAAAADLLQEITISNIIIQSKSINKVKVVQAESNSEIRNFTHTI